MEHSDEELMRAYQSGDEAAFEALYRRYSRRVFGYLTKRLNSTDEVEEVFQAVFIKLHRSRSRFDPKYQFAPWLFTICRTTLIDAARTGKVYREIKETPLSELQVAAETEEERADVDLSVLPEEQAEVLKMRYHDEMPFEEIARRLGTTSPTIRKRVSRAIAHLRKKVTP